MYLLVENSSMTIAYLYIWYDHTCPDDIAQEFVYTLLYRRIFICIIFSMIVPVLSVWLTSSWTDYLTVYVKLL